MPSVALSQFVDARHPLDWEASRRLARQALQHCLAEPAETGFFWNVNLPHLAPALAPNGISICCCEPDANPQDVRYRAVEGGFEYAGRYAERPSAEGRDVALCFSGAVTVSKLAL